MGKSHGGNTQTHVGLTNPGRRCAKIPNAYRPVPQIKMRPSAMRAVIPFLRPKNLGIDAWPEWDTVLIYEG